jgi:hypothetical protein
VFSHLGDERGTERRRGDHHAPDGYQPETAVQIITVVKARLLGEHAAGTLGVFGSYVRNEQHDGSALDGHRLFERCCCQEIQAYEV